MNQFQKIAERVKSYFTDLLQDRSAHYFVLLAILFCIAIFGASVTCTSLGQKRIAVMALLPIASSLFAVAFTAILMLLPRKLYSLHPYIFTLATLILYANSIYYRFFNCIIPTSLYFEAGNLMHMSSENVTQLLRFSDITIVVLIVAAFTLLPKLRSRLQRPPHYRVLPTLATLCFIIFFYQSMYSYGTGSTYSTSPHKFDSKLKFNISQMLDLGPESSNALLRRYSLPYSIIFDLIYSTDTPNITEEKIAFAESFVASQVEKNIADIEPSATLNNLIVVLVESLDYNAELSLAMPFTHKLAMDKRNIYIPKVKDCTGVGRSMDGQLMTLTGLQTIRKRLIVREFKPDIKIPSLAKLFNNSTLSTITNHLVWKQDIAAEALGIKRLTGCEISEERNVNNWLSDKTLFRCSMEIIDTFDRETPFFYTIVTGDSHGQLELDVPYYPLPDELDEETKKYYISLQSTDLEIERLYHHLDETGLLDNTTIVIVADHSTDTANIAHIPLIIVNPANNPEYRPTTTPTQISIYPTILHAMGIVDSTYMGLTPSMLSPRFDELTEEDYKTIEQVSLTMFYKGN